MSIGLIAAGIRLLNDQLKPSPPPQPGAAPPAPATNAPATAGTGPTDPFHRLSAGMQAKLLQLQATGSDATQASSALGKGMKPHHHPHGKNPDASASTVPGATPASDPQATNNSLVEAIRKAMQAYSASAAHTATAPIATV